MADATGLGRVSGPDKNQFSDPVDAGGKLGRYTVAIGQGATAKAEEVTHAVVVYTEKVSLLDRIVNWITGALDKEKNEALVAFIETGEAKVFNFATEKLQDESQVTGSLTDRLNIFEKLMRGDTGAKLDQKKAACEAFEQVIEGALSSNEDATKKLINEALSRILSSTKDGELKPEIIALQEHLATGLPSGVEIDRFVSAVDIQGNILDDDYLGRGLDDERAPSPFVIGGEDVFYSGSIAMPDGGTGEASMVATPLADALDGLAGKIKASDGTEDPAIVEMKDLLEAGTQPVVLLEKLEKLYDSPSVKYNDGKRQAVREAAKEIYDKEMHGNDSALRDANRIVDALVGLEFKGIHAMRLGEAASPLEL